MRDGVENVLLERLQQLETTLQRLERKQDEMLSYIARLAVHAQVKEDGLNKTIHQLSAGNIRPAATLIRDMSGGEVTITEVDGKAPYAEWVRLGATLQGLAQEDLGSRSSRAAQALIWWNILDAGSQALRTERERHKMNK